MADPKPPVTAELLWSDHLRFGATSGPNAIVIDADGDAARGGRTGDRAVPGQVLFRLASMRPDIDLVTLVDVHA